MEKRSAIFGKPPLTTCTTDGSTISRLLRPQWLGPALQGKGPLALAIGSFAEQLEDIAISQLAGVPNDDPAQAARLGDADTAMTQLADICS